MTNLPLGLRAWASLIGREHTRRVLALAAISALHFRGMANYSRTCTPATFERIEGAAVALGAPALPDFETCTRPSVRRAATAARASSRAAAARIEQSLAADRAATRATLHANPD